MTVKIAGICRLIVCASAAAFGIVLHLAAQAAQEAPAPVAAQPAGAVVVMFADGRRMPINVGPTSGGGWTPQFPRLGPWTPPKDELPVSAINFVCERLPDGINVAISVFRGTPHQREDPIGTVLVAPGKFVVVDAMKTVGLQPITLTLVSVTTPDIALPQVVVASPRLEVVTVEFTAAPSPRHRVVLRNHAAQPVRSIHIDTMRGGRLATSGRRTGREGAALIEVGATFVLEVSLPAGRPEGFGPVPLAPFDRINIDAIVWSDGSYEGSVNGLNEIVGDYGDRLGLTFVLAELRRARANGAAAKPDGLRAALLGISIEPTDAMIDDTREHVPPIPLAPMQPRDRLVGLLRVSLNAIKKTALDDLAAFESAPAGAGTFDAWLNTTIDRYRRWLDRLPSR